MEKRPFHSALFFLTFLISLLSAPAGYAALGAPCTVSADCELCAGEACSQGQCVTGGAPPCRLTCTQCVQNGDQTSCVESQTFCSGFSVSCATAECDGSQDFIYNPSGCGFVLQTQDPVCNACGVCGNGVCEFPETTQSCLSDCLSPGAGFDLPSQPISFCGPLDLPGVPMLNCNDGDVCTDDACVMQTPTTIGGTCSYQPKGCSGATQDACCTAGCVSNAGAGNFYDADCCLGTPSPSPEPSETPVASLPPISPNPQQPGPSAPGARPMLSIFGGGCGLNPAAPNLSAPLGLIAAVFFFGICLRRK